MSIIHDELDKLGIVCGGFSVLQDKDGITVARVASDDRSYVLKCFQKDEHKRELKNYRILAALGIPTIRIIASTDSALLLEDIECSPNFRMAAEEDLSDPEVARQIALWYKQLHSRGYDYVSQYGGSMYDESDFFAPENIDCIKERTGTRNAPAWTLLEQDFDAISDLLRRTRRTLTYNDFYYTNMVVAKDRSSALMFDYNLLGKGCACTDVRNVLFSLSQEAGKAFLDAYGGLDPAQTALDDVVSTVVALYMACQREEFPWWAREMLDELDTTFADKIARLRKWL